MASPADDRCGSRHRRGVSDSDHSSLSNGDVLTLSPRGAALLDALREDPRYRDLIADPFGDGRD
jgi:archaeosine-15-forming tRNA-guanine transglycosylase